MTATDIPRAAFHRVIAAELPNNFRLAAKALDILQLEGERHVAQFLEQLSIIAKASGRQTITMDDVEVRKKLSPCPFDSPKPQGQVIEKFV